MDEQRVDAARTVAERLTRKDRDVFHETRAVLRSGMPSRGEYLGNSDRFDRAIAEFAESYADQNERDYAGLTQALDADGSISRSHTSSK